MKHILTDRALNREILRLSVPSILANLTVPLVGMVDTALAGHLVDANGGSAVFIGGISVGAMLLNLLYWNFFFLRTGTGGLTAQAFGRENRRECADIFFRGLAFAAAVALLILVLQRPLARLGLLVVSATPRVCELALRYFSVRIWAVPATLGLMVFRGWFVGMQDSMSSMWTDLVVNITNIWASVVLTFGIVGWGGIGFDGIALGTVVAQYAGLLYAVLVCVRKYRHVLGTVRREDLSELLRARNMVPFLKMNGNLLGRSLCFTGIYMGYTIIASAFGDVLLACSSIMMQLLMIFSYFTDGFAYAGEALSGRFIGAQDRVMLRKTVRYVFLWSMSIAVLSIGMYALTGLPLVRLFTSDDAVVEACRRFLPWLLVMPPLGCAAFTWDGIYLGATASRSLFLSMAAALAGFFATWFGWLWLGGAALTGADGASVAGMVVDGMSTAGSAAAGTAVDGMATAGMVAAGTAADICLHVLLAAYFVHLAARTVCLTVTYRRDILSKV
ncbi:MAG: MATE family efflux transporter [Bacteroidales bacterium]|nr:MATE family efflux transporter [Bacteroidales bacterium]